METTRLLISSNSGLHSARTGRPRYPMTEAMDFFADAGFEAVDVNFAATVKQGEFLHEPVLDGENWRENVRAVRARAEERGLAIFHTHAPFKYRYLDREAPEFPLCDEMMHRSLEATALLGAKHAVVHPVVRPDRSATEVSESIQALGPLADNARGFGVRLAVENMSSSEPEEIRTIADAVDADICWDAGHAHIHGLDQEESLKLLGQRVKVLHLHDNYGSRGRSIREASKSDLHQPPYYGDLDWQSLLRGLKAIGFTGGFNFEVASARLPDSLRMDNARYIVKAARGLLDGAGL